MSFPRYPKYKDSGVEWLDEVPEHWEVKPLKHLATIDSCGSYGVEPDDAEIVLPVATTAQIDADGRFAVEQMPQRGFVPSEVKRYGCSDGDILVVKSSGSATNIISGKAGLVDEATPPFVFSNFLMRIRSTRELALPKFIYALLRSNLTRQRVELMCSTTTYPNLKVSEYSSAPLPIPPIPEQTLIAAFLDREVAKIDELVAEQQRLMELLKEKRQAVISHAVTKGLNPNASMKPSGIEWLGDVPEHWKVGKCGFYLTILSGFAFPSTGFADDENGTKLLRGINVGVSRLKWDETVYWRRMPNDDLDIYEMQAGDLVIGMDRPLISEGIRVSKVKQSDLPCLLLQRVASLKTGELLNPDYFLGLLSSEMFVAHFSPDTTGVSVPHISPEQIYNFVIPVPPLTEQEAITKFMGVEISKCDTLTAEAQRAIDLLQERRTALISAAVTGQIDVRNT